MVMSETASRILVVDDEATITDFVGYALKKEGYNADIVQNGDDAIALAGQNDYDLYILDIMLPGMDRALRPRFCSCPPVTRSWIRW